ncbi:hypothetical protein CACET_c31710 [Clostridium aceticum]|uniref:Uncharacterized protein n=1 Tax=Clostridium aceticum TaxID=84022 RepID=A0A0D8I7P3_9CLOT|nr:hypothetical protein [Clostridium aceticum]AKL96615.1 hypothetical protein CACET_c31710 [Clostridium aceticum]KJF26079.1 hypothetical protein TZ02_15275 [Clostridium aceticum]
MAKIQCPKDYNYWYILKNAGIDPVKDSEKYSYDEEREELSAQVNQEVLENALNQYDHQAWLKELAEIQNPKSEIELLRLEQAQANAELFEMMLMLTGGGF